MVCCFVPALKPYWKWRVTPDILVPRSASSVCFTPGTRNSSSIPMFIVLSRRGDSHLITLAGFDLVLASFFPSQSFGVSFAASSSPASSRPFSVANFTFPGIWHGSPNLRFSLPGCGYCSEKTGSFIANRPFGGPEYVLHYLGRYTHRVAISNHRLVSFKEDQVTFLWRDSAHNNQQKLMTLSVDEFLRRFLLHLLPKGFVRIRHFGFLAHRRRAKLLPLCFAALSSLPAQTESEPSEAKDLTPVRLCPNCGGPMVVIERLTSAQIQLRSPPILDMVAA